MILREPLFWGMKAAKKKEYYLKSLNLWMQTDRDPQQKLVFPDIPDFYLIKNPTNPHNLMEIVSMAQWFQVYSILQIDTSQDQIIGIGADLRETEELAAYIVEHYHRRYGTLDFWRLFSEEVPQ